ncbi:serine hydroxymethyltransferase [Elysia marginata]|uniref:Serine hydroxymethyltransferase n=1 Tax=Elysia marginata TaxID=1093978 RepID=A0AAV4FVN8_9GAST|nr:serine hydroxymethyltransferase [Elysia marginata]
MKDSILFDLIEKEYERQLSGLELIASENFVSPYVMKATGSVLTNKYAEGYPGRRYYGGCQVVDEIEQLAIDRAKELFNAEWVNVQPHSGSQANAAIYHSFLEIGDKVLGFDLSHGGHLTHGSPVSFSGKFYKPVFYGVEKETGRLNYETINEIAQRENPKMIIAGASSYSRDIEYKKFREIADSIGAFLWADIAHPCGLIVKGLLNDPVPHCHVVTTTTHKTLRGARGGLIILGKDFENPFGLKNNKGQTRKMSSILDSAVFPGGQGGPLGHSIAGKAVCFLEALSDKFEIYARRVQKNAKILANHFIDRDYNIVSDGTDNHMILIDLRNKGISGKKAEQVLGKAHITLNKNMVPFDDKSPFITSGIRIGSAAMTTRGLNETEMEIIVECIDEVIRNIDDNKIINKVGQRVKNLVKDYPLFQY